MSKLGALKQLLDILSPIRPQRTAQAPRAVDIAAELRGGEQPAIQLLQQLQGKPGIKPRDLEMWGQVPGAERMSPLELTGRAEHSPLFAQRGGSSIVGEDMATELADDLMWGPEMATQRRDVALEFLTENIDNLSPEDHAVFSAKYLNADPNNLQRQDTDWLAARANRLEGSDGSTFRDWVFDYLSEPAYEMAQRSPRQRSPFASAFMDHQRQPAAEGLEGLGAKYFETVLRGPHSMIGDVPFHRRSLTPDYHFSNASQLGHVRGTANKDMMMLEELQSDPLEALGAKHPAMQNIYGKLGNMALDRAAAADIPLVMFPDGTRIGSVRDPKNAAFFKQLYDRELDKSLFTPLSKQGLRVNQDNGWTNVHLPEAAREAIRGGQVLRYKKGGLNRMCDCGR